MSESEPLRILALLEASSITGTGKAVLEMALEAQANPECGIHVSVGNFIRGDASTENALTTALKSADVPYSFIRESGRFDRAVIPQIQDLMKEYNASIIWSNSVKSHFLVHEAGLAKRYRWVAFHHGYTSTDFKMRLYNELDRVSLRHAHRVLTVCEPFAEQMRARGVKTERIRVQHMPIRRFLVSLEDGAALRAELKLAADAKVILSIGRLSHEKGHKDLIAAFAQLHKTDAYLRLVMVGDGPELNTLRAQVGDYDLGESVIFAGHRNDASRFYGIANVFALPSYTEGTPNVVLEAMCAKVPVVATAVGGIPELAIDGTNALLVAAGNPGDLAKALVTLLKSPALCDQLTDAAETVVAAHSPRIYFEGMRNVFLEAADE